MQSQELFVVKNRTQMTDSATYGSAIKIFENPCKGFVLSLASTARLSLPRAARGSLVVSYCYVVFQIYIPSGRTLTIELGFTDNTGLRRRLVFMNTKEIALEALYAKIPNSSFIKDKWTNLCIDIPGNVQACFRGIQYRILDSIKITGACKVRRIYARRDCLEISQDTRDFYSFPEGVEHANQVIGGTLPVPKPRSGLKLKSPFQTYANHDSMMLDSGTPVKPRAIKSLVTSPDKNYLMMNEHYNKIIRSQLGPAEYSKCNISSDMLEKSMFLDKSSNKSSQSTLDYASTLPKITILSSNSSQNLKGEEEEIEEIIEYQEDKLTNTAESRKDNSIIELITRYENGFSREDIPNFYQERISKIMQVRHFTPPFVNISSENDCLLRYDPISKHYKNVC
jgi:hypothetical protein